VVERRLALDPVPLVAVIAAAIARNVKEAAAAAAAAAVAVAVAVVPRMTRPVLRESRHSLTPSDPGANQTPARENPVL